MRHYKTITFSILVTLAALVVVIVATRNTQSYNTADKKTLKVLRQKDHLGVRPTKQEIAAQWPQVERELEDNIPKHLPIKIKVRNLKSEKWVRDFAVEVDAPTPTPRPGGGGSGDGGGEDAYYCTHYYWVYYESYDDGETWREVDREYAGCW